MVKETKDPCLFPVLPVLLQRPTNGASMGQREGFSRSDIEKANRMYRCAEGGQTSPPISLPFPIPSFGGGSGGLPGGPNTYPGGPGLGGGYYPNNGVGGYPGYGFGGPQTYPYGYPGPYGYGLDEKK